MPDEINKLKVFRCILNSVHRIGSTNEIPNEEAFSVFKEISAEIFESATKIESRIFKNRTTRRIGRNVPLGYSKMSKGGSLVPNKQSELIQHVFHWHYYEKLSKREIAERLTDLGCRKSANSINYILRNPMYAGLVANRQGELIRGTFSPIVTEEVFYGVQRKGTYRDNKLHFPLNGLITVNDGELLWGHTVKPKYQYYKNDSKSYKKSVNINAIDLHIFFNEFCNEYLETKRNHFGSGLKGIHFKFKGVFPYMQKYMKAQYLLTRSLLNEVENWENSPPLLGRIRRNFIHAEKQLNAWLEFQDEETFLRFGSNVFDSYHWSKLSFEAKREFQSILFPHGISFNRTTLEFSIKNGREVKEY